MAKDPAFLFYTGDFSTGTQFLTDDQLGKYLRLLMAQHQLGHLKEKDMLKICKSYDEDIFNKFIKDDVGLFYNERLELEINNRKGYVKSRSDNRKGKKKKITYDNHMEDEDINENDNKNIKEGAGRKKYNLDLIDQNFRPTIETWLQYKISRGENYKSQIALDACVTKLKKLSGSNIETAHEIINESISNNWAGFFKLKNELPKSKLQQNLDLLKQL